MSRSRSLRAIPGQSERGQAMVEFALTVVIFIGLLLGVLDFGRAIFMSNGVAQAAREIARVASVHPGNPISNPSADTQQVIAGQRSIIFELANPTMTCVDITGQPAATPTGACLPGNWVKVEIHAPYSPVTPIFNLMAIDLESTSSVQIP